MEGCPVNSGDRNDLMTAPKDLSISTTGDSNYFHKDFGAILQISVMSHL